MRKLISQLLSASFCLSAGATELLNLPLQSDLVDTANGHAVTLAGGAAAFNKGESTHTFAYELDGTNSLQIDGLATTTGDVTFSGYVYIDDLIGSTPVLLDAGDGIGTIRLYFTDNHAGETGDDLDLRKERDVRLVFEVEGNEGGNGPTGDSVKTIYKRFHEHSADFVVDSSHSRGEKHNWLYLSVTYSSSEKEVSFYINGKHHCTESFTLVQEPEFSSLRIGSDMNGENVIPGRISNWQVFDEVLNKETIRDMEDWTERLWAIQDFPQALLERRRVYVDGSYTGSYSDGSPSQPFATIVAAIDYVNSLSSDEAPGTKVIVRPGVYREDETINIKRSGTRYEPIVLEAETPRTVIINGSKIWDDQEWTETAEGSGIWVHAWPHSWGDGIDSADYEDDPQVELSKYSELLHINGLFARPYISMDTLTDLTSLDDDDERDDNGFYIDNANDLVYLRSELNPNYNLIEVAEMEELLRFDTWYSGSKYLAVRGIDFTQSRKSAIISLGTTPIFIDNCHFTSTSGQAVETGRSDITVVDCVFDNTGAGTLQFHRDTVHALMQGGSISRSFWRNIWAGTTGADCAALNKIMFSSRVTVKGVSITNTELIPIWSDGQCRDISIDGCYFNDNGTGIWHEICTLNNEVINCSFYKNNRFAVMVYGEDVHIENNLMWDNELVWGSIATSYSSVRDEQESIATIHVGGQLSIIENQISSIIGVEDGLTRPLLRYNTGDSLVGETAIAADNIFYTDAGADSGAFSGLTFEEWQVEFNDDNSIMLGDDPFATGETPEVSFVLDSTVSPESQGAIYVYASLSRPSLETVTVEFDVQELTASLGSDFDVYSETSLTFPPLSMEQFVRIQLHLDDVAEFDEKLSVSLTSPTNAILGSITEHTVTIEGNEAREAQENVAPVISGTSTYKAPILEWVAINADVYDLNLDDLTYAWEQTDGPANIEIQDATLAIPMMKFSTAGAYELRLTVSDGAEEVAFTWTIDTYLNTTDSVVDGLLVHYSFDGDSSELIRDNSGAGNHGLAIADDEISNVFVSGVTGNAFDAATSHIIIPAEADDAIQDQFTVAFYANGENFDNSSKILKGFNEEGDSALIEIRLPWGTSVFLKVYNDTSVKEVSSGSYGDALSNGWHHWAFSYVVETGLLSIYLDGVLLTERTQISVPLQDIAGFELGENDYAGLIDEFMLFNYALDEIAIADLATMTPEMLAGVNTAVADTYSVIGNTVLTVPASRGVLANDSNAVSAIRADGALHGVVQFSADGSFEYTPEAGFSGIDEFSYQAVDANGDKSLEVSVSITVSDSVHDVEDASSENLTESTDDGGITYLEDENSSAGDSVTFTLNDITAGDYDISFVYAQGSDSLAILKLTVNGVVVSSNLTLPSTGSWSDWMESNSIDLTLVDGVNTIAIETLNANRAPNLVRVNVLPTALVAPITYTVTYIDENSAIGVVPVDTLTYVAGDTICVSSAESLAKDNYVFKAWNTKSDESGDAYQADANLTLSDASVTLYATWSSDMDGDGVRDSEDDLPNDPTDHVDTDGDGIGDSSDTFPNDPTESIDSDRDGVGDNADDFPNDWTEHTDSDGDGVGDNTDELPYDPTDHVDSDGDGVGDSFDAFPLDPLSSVDSDSDGLSDYWEIAAGSDPNDASIRIELDSDGDGLLDVEELAYGTDRYNADTDGDTYSDYYEINGGLDPFVADILKSMDGLLAWYSMNQTSSGLALDSSGNNNHAVVSSATFTESDERDLVFNITGNSITVPAHVGESISNELTIAFWAKGDEGQTRNSLVYSERDGSRLLNIHLPWDDTVALDAGNIADGYDRVSTSIPADHAEIFHHWAFTKNATTGVMIIYLDGEIVGSSSGKTKPMTDLAELVFGYTYKGLIDELCIFNKALDPKTIQTLVMHASEQNMAPIAYDQFLSIDQNSSIDFVLDVVDLEGGTLTYSISLPDHGTLSGTAPNLTYTPTPGLLGTDSFTYSVNDGTSESRAATVTVNVTSGVVSINFGSDRQSMSASDAAGVVPAANWNNFSGGSGTRLDLLNGEGIATTADVTYSASTTWLVGGTATSDERMMRGYLDGSAAGALPVVTVSQVPFALYDVYIYHQVDVDTNGGSVILNGAESKFIKDPVGTFSGSTLDYVEDGQELSFSSTSAGHYVKFEGVTGSSFSITSTRDLQRVGFTGMQIVNNIPTDSDGDGLTDAQEIALGTDPADSASTFSISNITTLSGNEKIEITWPSASGVRYKVWKSPDLINWTVAQDWSDALSTPVEALELDYTPTDARMFFRVEAEIQ